MKKELIIGLIALSLVTGAATQSVENTTGQEADVTVNVAGITALDVRPTDLTYDSVAPGERRNSSQDGYRHIELSNIGSKRIGEIYAQATMPDQQPFGTYSDTESDTPHNTGNFVTISLDTAQDYNLGALSEETTPHYVNRVEYFETNPPQYLTLEDGSFDPGASSFSVDTANVGRFRVGAAEYFFAAYEGTNQDQRGLAIGRTPHTPTQLGTTDLSSDGDIAYFTNDDSDPNNLTEQTGDIFRVGGLDLVSFNASESTSYDASSPLLTTGGDAQNLDTVEGNETRTYNLFVDFADDQITRTTFNVEQQMPTDGTTIENLAGNEGQEYILDAANPENALQPGQNFPVNFGIQLPLGVDSNAIQEGTVTLQATDTVS